VTPPLGESIAVDEALVILKVLFLVLLYLFIWRIVRTASKDVRLPQESFILRPGEAEAAGLSQPTRARRWSRARRTSSTRRR
jgi:hypothetical protein